MRSNRKTLVATALAVALAGGGFTAGREAQKWAAPADAHANDSSAAFRSNDTLPSFAELAARVAPAVVNIKATSMAKTDFPDQLFGENFPFPGFRNPMPRQPQPFRRQGSGSGLSSAKTA